MKLKSGISENDLKEALMQATLAAMNQMNAESGVGSGGTAREEVTREPVQSKPIQNIEESIQGTGMSFSGGQLEEEDELEDFLEDLPYEDGSLGEDDSLSEDSLAYEEPVRVEPVNVSQEVVPPVVEPVIEHTRPTTVNVEPVREPVNSSYDDIDSILNDNRTIYDGSAPVNKLPSKREEILENVDFFKKTPEQKFRDCDEAMRLVTEKMTADTSYLDIAPGVADMVVKRLKVYANKGVSDGAKRSYNSRKSDKHLKDSSLFTNDTVTVGGSPVKYTRHMEIPQWSLDLHECLTDGDKANNFEQVRIKITEELINYFGGYRRIGRIYVSSYQLIINDVCYIPKLSKQVLAQLPFDCADYIMNGNLAPFFNWAYLTKMNNLHTLSFDDVDFVATYVSDDMGMGRDFKPVLLFKHCTGLSTLCVGSDVIKYPLPEDEFEKEQVQKAVENVEYNTYQSNYFMSKCEKYYNATFNATKSVRQWSVGNLVNYANNRGNKGLIRYTGGLIARTAVTAGLAVPEAVTRVAGGIFGGIASTFKSARQATVNPVNDNNGGNQ